MRHLLTIATFAFLCAAIPAAAEVTLIPQNAVWKYDATGTDLGTAWRESVFDDIAWAEGNGILGYGETYINTAIPYGPDSNNKYRTTYFRTTFDLAVDPSEITQLTLGANYDDGFVAYLNGVEVARRAMPAGTIVYSTFAFSHESGTYEAIDLSGNIGDLIMGTNLLAVEVHQTTSNSSDLAWDASLSYGNSQVEFVWSGAVTDSSATVKAKLIPNGAVARLAVSLDMNMAARLYSDPDTADLGANNKVVALPIAGLEPDTLYYYMIEIDGVLDSDVQGRFRTFPPAGPATFTFAFGSCAQTGSVHEVFTTIESLDPLFFMHTGDLHYQNIGVNDPAVFRAAYETVLGSPTQSSLYRNVPIAYVWDDHDYGPNNSDSTAPGRLASRLTYQEYVPHYPLAAGTGDVPIYQTFTVGRVKFIVADSRSARSPASATDNATKTMLGTTQKAWFKQELLDANGVYPLIVWVNSLPWIGTTGDDGWHLYTNERRELADFIRDNGITGLCMISGDAHMIAIDDGTNSDYATGGGAPFPVMHAAALDRSGSVKGGPYSEGTYPGPGQFGLMTVTDTGGPSIDVAWSGRNWLNTELVSYSFSVFAGYGYACDCAAHGDLDDDGFFTSLDLGILIDYLFAGGTQPPIDPFCPHADRADVDCDGFDNSLDLGYFIDLLFAGGPFPCDPCACTPYPSSCP